MNKILSLIMLTILASVPAAFAEEKNSEIVYEFENTCAYAVSTGKAAECDKEFSESTTWRNPETDKDYCFFNEATKKSFAENTAKNLKRAEKKWQLVKRKKVSSLQ